MVADAPQQQAGRFIRVRGEPTGDFLVGFTECRMVAVGDFMRHHAAAGKAFPNEILSG
ncbi:hypothetical protein D3C80_2145980 [compost metagenome]